MSYPRDKDPEKRRLEAAFAETIRILRDPASRPCMVNLPGVDVEDKFGLERKDGVVLFWQGVGPKERGTETWA